MPRRKNVLGGVGITVVTYATFRASPFSYSKTYDTFRPRLGHCATSRAGLGGKHFVDFLEQHARAIAFVLKHYSEHRPACVQDGFRHFGLCKAHRVHVPNEDRPMLFGEPGAEFVQKVFPAVCYLCTHLPAIQMIYSLDELAL
jgi:hypothetical protein